MYDRILIPTDGSDVAASAASAAVGLARQFDADLHAIHVVETEPFPVVFEDVTAELAEQGRRALEAIEERATDADVEATTTVIEDGRPVHRAVLEYADEHGIDLVVMGTHGRTGLGRVVLGSATEQTLRESPVPVMTVHDDTTVGETFTSILVPFDGSDGAHAAVDHAFGLARATGATVHLLNVVDHGVVAGGDVNVGMVLDALEDSGERALETVAERAEREGVDIGDASVRIGSPFRSIVEYADEEGVDCIVMGTHGRAGIDRVLLGSVAERVIRQTSVPVIATKPDDSG